MHIWIYKQDIFCLQKQVNGIYRLLIHLFFFRQLLLKCKELFCYISFDNFLQDIAFLEASNHG